MKLENAIKAAQAAETAADIDLNGYINWVRDLQATAADLHTAKNRLLEIVEQKPDAPTDELDKLHAQFVDETTAAIGNQYATTLAMWQDTYQSFANVMRDSSMRRSARLDAMSDLFRAMFIDRQPAYPLYRHWHDLTERSSEFPAPPTDDPEAAPGGRRGRPAPAYRNRGHRRGCPGSRRPWGCNYRVR